MEFEVVKGVLDDGTRQAGPGEVVELTRKDADALVERGIVRPVEKRRKPEKAEG
jgi:hypothetical protein